MQAAGIVGFDETRDADGDVLESCILHKIRILHLQRLHEALGLRVVVGIAAPAHRPEERKRCPDHTVSALTCH